ncbi:hypothetical protein H310_06159 [Aphanomyces invadans]|nr:hypothetical protein H310_06159 [Aphanomyces invadans]ETW01485.1 hypothetical protein H310_06159 [Aphanomyces invadans]|eukprot:XP_008869333.1 hypothetical protein H310_06159 [Aphanomyces invadans]
MCILSCGLPLPTKPVLDVWQREAIDTQNCHDHSQGTTNTTASVNTLHPFFDCFRNHDEISVFLEHLLRVDQPHRQLSKVQIATSVQGRPIFGYNWASTDSMAPSKDRSLLYIQAGIHPREWALAAYDVVFVPVVNVDGYRFTWAAPRNRLWRKNLHGVDLNRNFGPRDFFTPSSDEFSEMYSGLYATSEPETRGVRNYVRTWLSTWTM